MHKPFIVSEDCVESYLLGWREIDPPRNDARSVFTSVITPEFVNHLKSFLGDRAAGYSGSQARNAIYLTEEGVNECNPLLQPVRKIDDCFGLGLVDSDGSFYPGARYNLGKRIYLATTHEPFLERYASEWVGWGLSLSEDDVHPGCYRLVDGALYVIPSDRVVEKHKELQRRQEETPKRKRTVIVEGRLAEQELLKNKK